MRAVRPLPSVLAQREMEKQRSPLVWIPPLRGGDFQGIGGLSSDDFCAVRCRQRESHEPQWSLQNRAFFFFLAYRPFSSEKFGARIA
jgi:hypothetical protein